MKSEYQCPEPVDEESEPSQGYLKDRLRSRRLLVSGGQIGTYSTVELIALLGDPAPDLRREAFAELERREKPSLTWKHPNDMQRSGPWLIGTLNIRSRVAHNRLQPKEYEDIGSLAADAYLALKGRMSNSSTDPKDQLRFGWEHGKKPWIGLCQYIDRIIQNLIKRKRTSLNAVIDEALATLERMSILLLDLSAAVRAGDFPQWAASLKQFDPIQLETVSAAIVGDADHAIDPTTWNDEQIAISNLLRAFLATTPSHGTLTA